MLDVTQLDDMELDVLETVVSSHPQAKMPPTQHEIAEKLWSELRAEWDRRAAERAST